jgi:hypothetical protein
MSTTKLLIVVEGGIVTQLLATDPELVEVAYISDFDKRSDELVLVGKMDVDVISPRKLEQELLKDSLGRWKSP